MPVSETTFEKLINRLETVCTQLEKHSVMPSDKKKNIHQDTMNKFITNGFHETPKNMDGHDNILVSSFDEELDEPLQNYYSLSHKIGGPVAKQADLVKSAFGVLKDVIITATQHKAPPDEKLVHLFEPLANTIQQITEVTESNRTDPNFNDLSVISNSIPALAWINVKKTPAPFIKDMLDSGTFYANKVIMEHKGKDENHVEFVKSWTEVLNKLRDYVKKHHTTGLVWNAQASNQPEKLSGGGGQTANLKKVTDSEKNYKNKELKASGTVPGTNKPMNAGAAPSSPGKANLSLEAQIKDKKPLCELQNNKWVVEYQLNNPGITINTTEIKQNVYVYKCVGSTIIVKGKCNCISLDNCKKCSVLFENLIGNFEATNCEAPVIQVTHKVPLFVIENCDGAQIYLSKESMDSQLITAKSTQVNMLVPTDEEGDYKEHPIPEQYKTVWDKDHFVTTPVEKKG